MKTIKSQPVGTTVELEVKGELKKFKVLKIEGELALLVALDEQGKSKRGRPTKVLLTKDN